MAQQVSDPDPIWKQKYVVCTAKFVARANISQGVDSIPNPTVGAAKGHHRQPRRCRMEFTAVTMSSLIVRMPSNAIFDDADTHLAVPTEPDVNRSVTVAFFDYPTPCTRCALIVCIP
ncbi:hypothetical protein Taro_044011 [Colocasia esculenta]|uniref:Uncharacterized protein n=1 Tax=Colocasia esculenta TaxID=4460 RepID=A0A843X1U7_COLES|nr:hypothetical protein [Colocasia esculenta]